MRLKVSDIPDDGLQQEREVPVVINDSARPDVARVFLKIFKTGEKVFIEGSFTISVTLKCSRCLKEFSSPLDVTFRDEYNPAGELEHEDEQQLTGTELDVGFYSNDEIDISELIKEQVLLAVPMKPLCKSDCQGICSQCGRDLNEGACACKAEGIDPRLAPLEKLKEMMKERKTS